jgi:hypothetical protein
MAMSYGEYNQETETHRQVGLSQSRVTSVEMPDRCFPFPPPRIVRSMQHL